MEKRHLTHSITTLFFSRLNTHKTITIKPRKDLPLISLSLSDSKKNQRNEGRRRQKERGETVATSAPPPTTAGLVTPAPPHDNGRGSSAHHAALTTGPGLRLHHRSNDGRVPVEVGSSLAPLLRRQDRVFAEEPGLRRDRVLGRLVATTTRSCPHRSLVRAKLLPPTPVLSTTARRK